jgi:hypothetical protein
MASLCVSVVGVAAALAVVPEVRRAGRLNDIEAAQVITPFTDSLPANTEPVSSVDSTATAVMDTTMPPALASDSLFATVDSLAAAPAPVPQPPARTAESRQRRRLLGSHGLTVQWIGWDPADWGRARITESDGVLYLEGEQRGQRDQPGYVMKTDFLTISGRIVAVQDDGFTFERDIVTRSHYQSHSNGAECKRSGTFHFAARYGRQYWRLQEMQSPCDTATDYVDIYF